MYHRRIALFSGAAALTSFFAVGIGGSTALAGASSQPQAIDGIHVASIKTATIHTETVAVGSKVETVLANANGLPLYYFRADSATKSKVSGGLARLWPPVITAKPTATGLKGKVVALKQAAGPQVSYNGHFLYTFIDDSPGHVTGQGVSNFFVATPKISAIGKTAVAAPSPTSSTSHGYGY